MKNITAKTLILLIVIVGGLTMQSCKKKVGCTDTSSPNYDPEATHYEIGSCENATQEINAFLGNYSGPAYYDNGCNSGNFNETIQVTPSGNIGYITISYLANFYTIDFLVDNNNITADSQVLTSSPYIELTSATGILDGNELSITLNTYQAGCGSGYYIFTVEK